MLNVLIIEWDKDFTASVSLSHKSNNYYRIYLTLKQNMGEQPTCDLWDETARKYVDSYCENEGSKQGCHLILWQKKIFLTIYCFSFSSKCVWL